MTISDKTWDETTPKRTVMFWWLTLGAVVSGTSLFNVIVTYGKYGLTGLGSLVHEKYGEFRDLIFDNLEHWFPLPHLESDQRAVVIGLTVFVGVLARTYAVLSDQVWTPALSLGSVVAWVTLALSYLVFVFATPSNSSEYPGLIIALIVVMLLFRSSRLTLALLALNATACAVVAISLLALGGAF